MKLREAPEIVFEMTNALPLGHSPRTHAVIFPSTAKAVNRDGGDVEIWDTGAERMKVHGLLPRFFSRVTGVMKFF